MKLKFEDFTPEQRLKIAEFVYSYDSDILIKTDAIELVDVLLEKEIVNKEEAQILKSKIEANHYEIVEELIGIVFTEVVEEEGVKIMKEYFGRKVS